MAIVADTHVHLYPCYDIGLALARLGAGLRALGPGATRVACLAERRDCRSFAALRDRAGGAPGRVRVAGTGEDAALAISDDEGAPYYLVAGRQLVTEERVEILALAVEDVGDVERRPAREVVRAVLDAGGVPIVGWAPGKWFFGRRAVVEELFRTFEPGELLAGDTTLRPTVWGEPRLMRAAATRRFGVVAGSDPLPFPGEDRLMGSYGVELPGEIDPDRPVASLGEALRGLRGWASTTGGRCSLLAVLRRLALNAVSRH